MPSRMTFFELDTQTQNSIREFELVLAYKSLSGGGAVPSKDIINLMSRRLVKYVNNMDVGWTDEIGSMVSANYKPTKDQIIAYLYLKGLGINKMTLSAKVSQIRVEEFIANPRFDIFPKSHQFMWFLNGEGILHKGQHELVSSLVLIKPNICGGFYS